jgi:hypothetical protein
MATTVVLFSLRLLTMTSALSLSSWIIHETSASVSVEVSVFLNLRDFFGLIPAKKG